MIYFFTWSIFGTTALFIGQKYLWTKMFAHYWHYVTSPEISVAEKLFSYFRHYVGDQSSLFFLVMDVGPKFNFFLFVWRWNSNNVCVLFSQNPDFLQTSYHVPVTKGCFFEKSNLLHWKSFHFKKLLSINDR